MVIELTNKFNRIEHSENKIITQSDLLGNGVGPGGLHSSLQQTYAFKDNNLAWLMPLRVFHSVSVVWYS